MFFKILYSHQSCEYAQTTPLLENLHISHIITKKNLLRICFLISLAGSNQFWKGNDSLHLNQRSVNMTMLTRQGDTHAVYLRVSGCWKALQAGPFPHICCPFARSWEGPGTGLVKKNAVSTIHSNKILFFYNQWLQGLKLAEKQNR